VHLVGFYCKTRTDLGR